MGGRGPPSLPKLADAIAVQDLGMEITDRKATLHEYLRRSRDDLLSELDGLEEHDAHRALTRTGKIQALPLDAPGELPWWPARG